MRHAYRKIGIHPTSLAPGAIDASGISQAREAARRTDAVASNGTVRNIDRVCSCDYAPSNATAATVAARAIGIQALTALSPITTTAGDVPSKRAVFQKERSSTQPQSCPRATRCPILSRSSNTSRGHIPCTADAAIATLSASPGEIATEGAPVDVDRWSPEAIIGIDMDTPTTTAPPTGTAIAPVAIRAGRATSSTSEPGVSPFTTRAASAPRAGGIARDGTIDKSLRLPGPTETFDASTMASIVPCTSCAARAAIPSSSRCHSGRFVPTLSAVAAPTTAASRSTHAALIQTDLTERHRKSSGRRDAAAGTAGTAPSSLAALDPIASQTSSTGRAGVAALATLPSIATSRSRASWPGVVLCNERTCHRETIRSVNAAPLTAIGTIAPIAANTTRAAGTCHSPTIALATIAAGAAGTAREALATEIVADQAVGHLYRATAAHRATIAPLTPFATRPSYPASPTCCGCRLGRGARTARASSAALSPIPVSLSSTVQSFRVSEPSV